MYKVNTTNGQVFNDSVPVPMNETSMAFYAYVIFLNNGGTVVPYEGPPELVPEVYDADHY